MKKGHDLCYEWKKVTTFVLNKDVTYFMSAKELSASFLATFGGLSLNSVDSWN